MSEFELLGPDDVVSTDYPVPVGHSPFFGKQLLSTLQGLLAQHGRAGHFFTDGMRCQVLRPGGEWRKGRLLLQVQFIPDEPAVKKVVDAPSVLDEFRQ